MLLSKRAQLGLSKLQSFCAANKRRLYERWSLRHVLMEIKLISAHQFLEQTSSTKWRLRRSNCKSLLFSKISCASCSVSSIALSAFPSSAKWTIPEGKWNLTSSTSLLLEWHMLQYKDILTSKVSGRDISQHPLAGEEIEKSQKKPNKYLNIVKNDPQGQGIITNHNSNVFKLDKYQLSFQRAADVSSSFKATNGLVSFYQGLTNPMCISGWCKILQEWLMNEHLIYTKLPRLSKQIT